MAITCLCFYRFYFCLWEGLLRAGCLLGSFHLLWNIKVVFLYEIFVFFLLVLEFQFYIMLEAIWKGWNTCLYIHNNGLNNFVLTWLTIMWSWHAKCKKEDVFFLLLLYSCEFCALCSSCFVDPLSVVAFKMDALPRVLLTLYRCFVLCAFPMFMQQWGSTVYTYSKFLHGNKILTMQAQICGCLNLNLQAWICHH